MTVRWGIAFLLVILLAGSVVGQELSTDVYASEDEIREAFENGDISFEQYIRLLEIIIHGVDSTNLYLFDEIPNLLFLQKLKLSLDHPQEQIQKIAFKPAVDSRIPSQRRLSGKIGYQFRQMLEEGEQSWYRSWADLRWAETVRARFRVDRNKSGIERFVSRSLAYSPENSIVKTITLGSFTTRFGLGTLFGYHGKRFDFSEAIDVESFLYPDYGGYNGLLIKSQTGSLAASGLVSFKRDADYSHLATGLLVQSRGKNHRPGLQIGLNRLTNRQTEAALDIPMVGILDSYHYRNGYVAAEIGRQFGPDIRAGASVVEGRHRFGTAELRFTGWHYSDRFADLTAGSKAGYSSHRDTLAAVGFVYSNRRAGQTGLLAKTIVELSDNLRLSSGVLLSKRAPGDTRRQFSSSLIKEIDPNWMLQLIYQGDWRSQPGGSNHQNTKQRLRLEAKFRSASTSARCYIGYLTQGSDHDHVSFFVSLWRQLTPISRVQLWTNFGEIDSGQLQYAYLFVKGDWHLWDGLRAAVKLSNTYRRNRDEKHQTQLMFEMNASL